MTTAMMLYSNPAAFYSPSSSHSSSSPRFRMSASSLPPPPDNRVVLGCGAVTLDFLAAVSSYPKPDDKIRSTSSKEVITDELNVVSFVYLATNDNHPTLKVQGGGNAGNALTCAARLGLKPRLISKVAADSQGKGILEELEADGVDSSFLVVSEEGNSPFTYIIVDDETKTRTCIHTPGYPPMIPNELTESKLLEALDEARLVYLDGRLHETALVVAREAAHQGIPILIDAEKKREGLDDLLSFSSYIVCSAKFPQEWAGGPSVPSALVSMLLKLPNIKFVIVTLGEDGCIMLERSNESSLSDEVDVDELLVTLKHKKDGSTVLPTCVSSHEVKLQAKATGSVSGRMLLGTAENIPSSALVDTTGAGDSFIGAVLYALCADMPPEKMLPFAAQVAGIGCRSLGARTGLPWRTDPRLTSFLV